MYSSFFYSSEKARGFGFVQFEELEDAEAAMDNMHSMSRQAHSHERRTSGGAEFISSIAFTSMTSI